MAESRKLEIVYRPLAEIRHYPNNARTHTPQQIVKLKKSLAKFGWTNPLLIADGELLCGHARTDAAIEMAGEGMPIQGNSDPYMAPTIDLSHLSKSERRAYILMDNRSALDSGWDGDLLRSELLALKELDFDLSLTGFEMPELSQWTADATSLDPNAEWQGMPEFEQTDAQAFRSITVHFASQTAVDEFARLIGQDFTPKTKFTWYPMVERNNLVDQRYVDATSVPDLHTIEG